MTLLRKKPVVLLLLYWLVFPNHAASSDLIDTIRPVLLVEDYALESVDQLKASKCGVPSSFWEAEEVKKAIVRYRRNVNHGAYHVLLRIQSDKELSKLINDSSNGREANSDVLARLERVVSLEFDIAMDSLESDLASLWRSSKYPTEASHTWETCKGNS